MQLERASDSSWEDEPSGLAVGVGDVLDGKYRVLRVLGKGGMGVIMAAVHLDLGHHVALKFLLRSAIHNEDVVARFAREARAAAMIQSEHATRVFDVGRLPTGEPYMVLELLEGSDLGAILTREGPLSVEDAITYVLEACEAIAEAHSLGIVHRDLKPDNLFLARRPDGSRSVKVLDFGISKLPLESAESSGKGSPLTTTSAVIGSPMYMSPEQLRATRDVDPRSDIWSLGVTLYELLTGEGPFPWRSLPELCAAVLKDAPTPIRALRNDVPEDLEAALLRCIEKNPKDRFADVGELASALATFGRPSAQGSRDRALRLLSRAPARTGSFVRKIPTDDELRASAMPFHGSRGRLSSIERKTTSPDDTRDVHLRTTMADPRQSAVPPSSPTPPVSSTAKLEGGPPVSRAVPRRRRWSMPLFAATLPLGMGLALLYGSKVEPHAARNAALAQKNIAAEIGAALAKTKTESVPEAPPAVLPKSAVEEEAFPARKNPLSRREKAQKPAAPGKTTTTTEPPRPRVNPFADRE